MNRLLLSNSQNSENEEKASSKRYVKKKTICEYVCQYMYKLSLFLRAKRERGKERNIHVRLRKKLYQNSLTLFPILYKQ